MRLALRATLYAGDGLAPILWDWHIAILSCAELGRWAGQYFALCQMCRQRGFVVDRLQVTGKVSYFH